jgi:hypothetical protein
MLQMEILTKMLKIVIFNYPSIKLYVKKPQIKRPESLISL